MTRIIQNGWKRGESLDALITREWLVTNALGGYASGTIAGIATRRYHGKLIAALPAPLGRIVMLNFLEEDFHFPDGSSIRMNGDEKKGAELRLDEREFLDEFRLENGMPTWIFRKEGFVLEKRLTMPNLQNTTYLQYRVLEGPAPVQLRLRPFVHFRPQEELVDLPIVPKHQLQINGERTEIQGEERFPPLRLYLHSPAMTSLQQEEVIHDHLIYRLERSRGYRFEGPLWSPGYYHAHIEPGGDVTLVVSTESWDAIRALTPQEAFAVEQKRLTNLFSLASVEPEDSVAAQLVIAADQFIITPAATRTGDAARAHAKGEEPRTVIAGYHWFTDWGRDTMISLEGLTLCTGRHREAGSILRTFASYIRDGLIPNLFPEGKHEGLYHTADATLWFFHAVDRYLHYTGDEEMLRSLLPKLLDIVEHHLKGTRFGIGVDPSDGLLRQGAEGYQLTWMDAKVDDWVVTPRRGKAVEINALFYNALRNLADWLRDAGKSSEASRISSVASRLYDSFNSRFWYEEGKHLYDVVDTEGGDNDAALRPNQLFALSLPYPVLDPGHWRAVFDAVTKNLLTPVGLRSLAPAHRDYKNRYDGDLRARDAAYHQGTVWGWLIGPYIDAHLKLHPHDAALARQLLNGLLQHLGDAGIGTASEVFDAEAPFTPRGCIAQAWSIAEMIRCLNKTKAQSASAASMSSGVATV